MTTKTTLVLWIGRDGKQLCVGNTQRLTVENGQGDDQVVINHEGYIFRVIGRDLIKAIEKVIK